MNNFNAEQSKRELEDIVKRVFTPLLEYISPTINKRDKAPAPVNSAPASPRSSINVDLSCELDNWKSRDPPEQPLFCTHCTFALKRPLIPPVSDDDLLGYEHHVNFLRSIIWTKADAHTLKRIPFDNIRNIFNNFSAAMNQPSSANAHDQLIMNSELKQMANMVHLLDEMNTSSSKVQQCDDNNKIPETISIAGTPERSWTVYNPLSELNKSCLLPETDEEASQISGAISFGDESSQDQLPHCSSWNLTTAFESIADSGIGLQESVNNKSIPERNQSRPEVDNLNKRHRPEASSAKTNDDFKHPEERPAKKRLRFAEEETMSPMFVFTTLESLQINNLALNMVRVILSIIEDEQTAKQYNKGVLSMVEAASTIVDFISMLSTEESMYSSTSYVCFFTTRVMKTIKKICDSLSCQNLTNIEQQYRITTVLELCECKEICEKTIDLLINKLTVILEELENMDSARINSPIIMDYSDYDLFFYALQSAIEKYCQMAQRSTHYFRGLTHHNLIYTWQRLGRRIGIVEEREVRMKQLTMEWVDSLKCLVNKDAFVFSGTLECIERMIRRLSNINK